MSFICQKDPACNCICESDWQCHLCNSYLCDECDYGHPSLCDKCVEECEKVDYKCFNCNKKITAGCEFTNCETCHKKLCTYCVNGIECFDYCWACWYGTVSVRSDQEIETPRIL